jgi:hypothetical protein
MYCGPNRASPKREKPSGGLTSLKKFSEAPCALSASASANLSVIMPKIKMPERY